MKKIILLILTLCGIATYSQKNLDLEFTSSIDIEKKGFQLLLASQNYESNYAIYVKFNTNPKKIEKEDDKGKRLLINAEFKLLNYKAKVFMGIKNVKLEKLSETRNGRLSSHKIKIFVKGHMKWDNSTFTYNPPIDDKIYLKNNEILVSERYLLPMFYTIVKEDINNEDVTESEIPYYILEEYKDDLGVLKVWPHNYYVVDTEYFHMDGLSFIVPKAIYDNYPIENILNLKVEEEKFIPGPRCKTAYSSLQ